MAAIAAAVVLTGCPTTTGHPEPEASTTTTTTTVSTTTAVPTTAAPTTTKAPVSSVPPPANYQTITCREYQTLDESHQIAVLEALGGNNADLVAPIIDVGCSGFPDLTIADVLAGNLPE